MPYHVMQPEDMSHMRFDGGSSGLHEPSSEWRFHLEIYRARPEVGAVVHTHSGFATTLACLGRAIPAFHYMVALFGGADIRCSWPPGGASRPGEVLSFRFVASKQ